MTRYSDIKRGARLNNQLTNYIQYLSTPRTPNPNSRGARPDQNRVYVVPYGVDLGTSEVVGVNTPAAGYNRLAANVINTTDTQAEVADALGSKTAVGVSGFSPAKLVTFENATRSVTVATSDITQNKYLKYSGTRFACAFGRKTATDDIFDAFAKLKEVCLARTNLEVNRVSLTLERVRGR